MNNQTLTATVENGENKTFSKEDVSSICDVSINTLQNWLNDEKAEESDYKKGKQGKKIYYFSYLKRVFKKALREDLIDILETNSEVDQDKPNTNHKPTEALPNFDYATLLTQMSETIIILQEQLRTKDIQINNLHNQLEKQSNLMQNEQTLRLQQNQILLENKKSGGFFGFLGFGGKKKGKDNSEPVTDKD